MRMVIGTEVEYAISGRPTPHFDPVHLSNEVIARVRGTFRGATDRMLANGARVYVDHAHPEYSGPECRSASDALTWELAGDALVGEAAQSASRTLGHPLVLHRNNTDGKGRSYGYHENFLLPRHVCWDALVGQLIGHLVSRLTLVGAGRVGLGQASEGVGFQISQRADFMERLVGHQTTAQRPLVNARDEPHADPQRWRRLHLITGDATWGHVTTLVKVGATALVAAAIAAGECRVPRLRDPLGAMRAFSRDLQLTVRQPCQDGVARSALELQRAYWLAAGDYTDALEDGRVVLELWGDVLDDAERGGAEAIADRVDWAAKLRLLHAVMARRGWDWEAPGVAAADLQWHELDPDRGLAQRLLSAGKLATVVCPEEVARATVMAPRGTRAALRGALLGREQASVISSDWTGASIRRGGAVESVEWMDPFGEDDVEPPGPPEVGGRDGASLG